MERKKAVTDLAIGPANSLPFIDHTKCMLTQQISGPGKRTIASLRTQTAYGSVEMKRCTSTDECVMLMRHPYPIGREHTELNDQVQGTKSNNVLMISTKRLSTEIRQFIRVYRSGGHFTNNPI